MKRISRQVVTIVGLGYRRSGAVTMVKREPSCSITVASSGSGAGSGLATETRATKR